MKAEAESLLNILKSPYQFKIPLYQRAYSWTEKECFQLWNDIWRIGKTKIISSHFLGSLVYITEGIQHNSSLLVIDGQQRLTTVTLILIALSEILEGKGEMQGFSSETIGQYLVDIYKKDEKYYKLLLTQTDKETLKALVSKKSPPKDKSIRICENYEYFKKILSEKSDILEDFCNGLLKLSVVYIALDRQQDNAQLIFESMNSTGRELTQADLIRNFVLMGLEEDLQTKMYENYWRLIEEGFGQESNEEFDSFIRHYLTFKMKAIPNQKAVYEEFKSYADPFIKNGNIEDVLKEIFVFSNYYYAMALGCEKNLKLKSAFEDIKELEVNVAYPFFLELYDDYERRILSVDEFEKIIRITEAYVFRRKVCSLPTNALNKVFCVFSKHIDKKKYLSSVENHFLSLQAQSRFPNDIEFERDLENKDVRTICKFLFRRLENYNRKEEVGVKNYTVEHIMPRKLSKEWEEDLGKNFSDIHQNYLHTLGNLTLTGYNSRYSNKSFSQKRDMEGGFKNSPLRLNEGLGQTAKWTVLTIQDRAKKLAQQAKEIWKRPFVQGHFSEDIQDDEEF